MMLSCIYYAHFIAGIISAPLARDRLSSPCLKRLRHLINFIKSILTLAIPIPEEQISDNRTMNLIIKIIIVL